MAEPKELKLREGYEDPLRVQGFSPITLPDNTSALERNAQVEQQNLQREAQAENRTAELANLAGKINLDQNKDLLALTKSGVELMQFGLKQERERQIELGVIKARELGVDPDGFAKYAEDTSRMQAAGAGFQQIANDDMANGVPYEAAQVWRSLNYFQRIGFEKTMAHQAAISYGTWIENQFDQNPDYRIETEDGSFTLSQARQDPFKMATAIKQLDSQFYRQYDFLGKNLNLLSEQAFGIMNQSRDKLIADARKAYAINDSQQTHEYAYNYLVSTGDIFEYLRIMAPTVDGAGKHRSFKGAHDQLNKDLVLALQDKRVSYAQYQEMMERRNPETGKTYAQEWSRRYSKMNQDIAAANRQAGKDAITDRGLLKDQMEQQFKDLTLSLDTPMSIAKATEFDDQIFRETGTRSELIKKYIADESLEAMDLERQRQYANYLIDNFKMNDVEWARLPAKIHRDPDLKGAWERQKLITATPEFKSYLEGIEGLLGADVRHQATNKLIGDVAPLIRDDLQNIFKQKALAYMTVGVDGKPPMSPAAAANQAFQETRELYKTQSEKEGGKYYMPPNRPGEFPYFFGQEGAFKATSAAFALQERKIADALQSGAKFSTPNLISTKEELLAIEKGFNRPGWQFPDEYLRLAARYGRNPLDIMNAQRDAHKLPILKTPKSMQAAQALPPQAQHLLYQWQTANRNMRAWSQSGQFNRDIVPMQLGETIEKAAKKHKVDPAIVAGIIEWENRGDWRNRVSPAGAQGIAQIMPATGKEFGVTDPNDPVQSVEFVAKYIRYLTDYFNGDVKKAIYAYNGGMGSIERYGVGFNEENAGYYPGVMRGAAKYGYQGYWNDPQTMRPIFAGVIEHVTGDRSHPNYAADHGGANYHEHVAFSTVEEALKAKELLESKGYRVTSHVRKGDPGYHGTGQALDIAPPKDLPYDKVSEAEWSKGVRKLLGIN